MSGLLSLASCSAYSPAGAPLRGGPAARTAPGIPPVALVLSGGLHLAALALFLAAAARSGLEEPRLIERSVFVDPGIVFSPPPTSPPVFAGERVVDPRGRIDPVPPGEASLAENLEALLRRIGPAGGVRPEGPVSTGEGGGEPAPPTEVHAYNPEVPTDEVDQPPVPIEAPEPPYDEMAREAGIEGRVVLEALVTWEGGVREIRVREGNPMLAAPAVKCVKTWRFRPARWKGRPVSTWVSIPIVFRLH